MMGYENEAPAPRRRGRPPKSAARVDVMPNQPMQATVDEREAFMMRNQDRQDVIKDSVSSEGVSGTAVHTRPGTVVMYKPTERSGYLPRLVSVSAMPMLFKQGWYDKCPECNGHHVDRNGNVTTDPNACAAREPVKVALCPVCRKRIYDNMKINDILPDDEDDPNVVSLDFGSATTPEERLKQKVDLHLWIRHAEWAQANGVAQLPSAFREMVEGARGGNARAGVGT